MRRRAHVAVRVLIFVSVLAWALFAATSSDDFNRADNSSIGSNWAAVPTATIAAIKSNQAGPNAASAEYGGRYTATSFGNDQCSQMKATVASSGSNLMSVCVRISATQHTMYCFGVYQLEFGSAALRVVEFNNSGTPATLGATYATYAANDVLKLEVAGSTLTPSINSVAQATRTDTTITSGTPGFHVWNDSAVGMMDDWIGGDSCTAGSPAKPVRRTIVATFLRLQIEKEE